MRHHLYYSASIAAVVYKTPSAHTHLSLVAFRSGIFSSRHGLSGDTNIHCKPSDLLVPLHPNRHTRPSIEAEGPDEEN